MTSTEMAGLELTAASARALVQAGRLRELIGVAPDASPEEVKAASKRALLKYHPDKGGDAELFKIIQPAVEELQLDGNQYAFEGGIIPPWAKTQLDNIAQTRREIQECGERLQAAQAREETAQTGNAREKARVDITRQQQGIVNLTEVLALDLRHFKSCYTEHVEIEREAKEKEAVRQEREEATRELHREQVVRAESALRWRRMRGNGSRFPTLPKAVTNHGARDSLQGLRCDYQRVRCTMRKRKKNALDIAHLEQRAVELLEQGRLLVGKWCSLAHIESVDSWKRFPRLHCSDPRAVELAQLGKIHRQLKKRLQPGMPTDRRCSIQTRVDAITGQAMDLLEGRQQAEAQ
jgi:hypothetical protein